MGTRGDKFPVIYVDGDVPQLPIQLGQLLVDSSLVSPGTTNLQQCTDVDPVTYEPIGGGGGGTVDSVVAGTGIDVDATDPANPIVSVEASIISGAAAGATAVQPARTITAGAGLTGGGDLSANRTLAVDLTYSFTWTADHLWTDNDKVRLGTGGDMELYHNGTDSFIDNATGQLNLRTASTIRLGIAQDGAWTVDGSEGAAGQVIVNTGVSSPPKWVTAPNIVPNSLATEIMADSPSGYWKCDEASGNFVDSSGNGRDLTASGSITYQYAPIVPTEPTTSYAFFVTSSGKAVVSGTFSMAPLTGDYTIECVFVGTTYASNPTTFFAMGGSGELEAQNVQTSFRIDTNSRMSQFWESGAGTDTTVNTVIEVLEGKSYHYVCVKDGTANTVTYYLNGIKAQVVSYVNDPTGGTGTMETGIGNVSTVASNGFLIAHCAFYNGSKLSDARIVAHARAAGLFGN